MRPLLELFHARWRGQELSHSLRALQRGAEGTGSTTLIDDYQLRAHRPFSLGSARRPVRPVDEAAGGRSHWNVRSHPGHSRIFPAHAYREYWRRVQFVCRFAVALENGTFDWVLYDRDG